MKNLAHFFWQGKISPWEVGAMKSFQRHGWKVKLWSFEDHKVPGVESAPADHIMPKTGQSRYRYQGYENNPAAWSEFFRIRLLIKEGGWWFDTDCICLKDVEEFYSVAQDRPYVLGFEDERLRQINNAVQQFNDLGLAAEILEHLENIVDSQQGVFPVWGDIGSKHITEFLNAKGLAHFILPKEKFYPINGTISGVLDLLNPDITNLSMLKNSLVLHYWNFAISKLKIDKHSTMPPTGSILDLAMKGSL